MCGILLIAVYMKKGVKGKGERCMVMKGEKMGNNKRNKVLSLALSLAMVATPLVNVMPMQVQAAPRGGASYSYDEASPMVATSNKYPETYSRWMDGLLAGNGKQGAIIFGNPLAETVIYTDRDFFMAREEGKEHRTFADVAQADIDFIRNQLIAGNYTAANQRAADVQHYSGGGEGSKHPGYKMVMNTDKQGEVTDYMRATDYKDGVVYVNWTDSRGAWERESFVSRVNDVTVQYQEAPAGEAFDMSLKLEIDPGMNLLNKGVEVTNNSDEEFLNLRVKYPSGRFDAGYEGVTRVITDGTKTMDGDVLKISDATKVLLLTKTQRYNGIYNGGVAAETAWAEEKLQDELNELSDNYGTLKTAHTANHSGIMNRVSLAFNASAEDRSKTNEDLIAMQKSSATMVEALYERLFYAGRYHTLGSAYEKAAPDLLGNWTGDANVGWDGYYHLDANLNLQISGSNIGNMPEVMEGYTWLNKQWKEDFKTNARKLLKTDGMLVGGNTPNGEGLISNINFEYPYQYVTGGVSWLLYPIWEQYLITGDTGILQNDYYPLIREMGDFYEDFLKEKDSDGNYIFAGSISPENRPRDGVPLSVNSVYDIAGARFALTTLIRTANTLGRDAGKIATWQELLDNLPPYLINNDGALAEWAWPDLANRDQYQHRHASGLMPIWPYQEVTAENEPDLHEAAKVFLSKKDGGSYENAGHGLLHGAMIAAKLNNDSSVNSKLLRFVKDNYYYNGLATAHYNTVTPGVFCTDVANSVPTVLMEMLASTTEDTMELLPALPANLTKGSIEGMLGRNQATINELSWDMESRTIKVVLTPDEAQTLTLIQRAGIEEITSDKGTISASGIGNIAREISLNAGETTTIELTVGDVTRINLALNKPAEAGSESGTNTKENAFDGDTSSRWGANQNDDDWILVDLEDTYVLSEIVLNWEDSYAKKYKIQISQDKESWEDVHIQNDSDGGVETILLTDVVGRYVRMQSVQMSGEWGISLYEMEVYGGPLPNLALNKPSEALTESGTNTKEKAFDGDPGSRWGASQNAANWLHVDLEDTYEIHKVVVNWEDSYAKGYKIQLSDNGSTWVDVFEETNGSGGIDVIELTENNVGRYVRMQGVTMSGIWGYSIYEMEVYGIKSGESSEPPETEETEAPETEETEAPETETPEGKEDTTLYVSKDGNDANDGSEENPYLTINRAAQMAGKGTTVIVDSGVYRETVKPRLSGEEDRRITYTVKEGADVQIKGSEEIDTWVEHEGDVWKVVIPNAYFGDYNPYDIGHPVGGGGQTFAGYSCGDVYLDGEAYYQKPSLDIVSRSRGSWYAAVADGETTIYANFNGKNPNEGLAEINVREQVFAPDVWGLGYITVDGFTVMHAANGYSDFPDQPSRRQAGAISVYGGLKWIIQNNTVLNARTIGIDIGLSCDMWAGNRPGETKTDFRDTDDYGSHIVQNNYIAKCGQSGIAGVFSWNSIIRYNRIENNNYRGEFSGAETAPIKVHYMNYGLIQGNYIKSSKGGNSAGIWTDWGNQGVRVTGNIVINCPWGYYAEAMHGPALVDNNIFIGNSNIRTLDATGVVFANNLFYDNGNINVDGNGRNCFYFEPGTMNETDAMSGPVQQLFWLNNLVQGSTLPNNRDQITHVKEGNAVGVISNFSYEAGDEMSIKFDLDASGISGLTPVTKERVGIIPKANEEIAADVLKDYFDEEFGTDSLLVGPFADIQEGTNEFKLWPIDGQETPTPPADAADKPANLALLETSSAAATYSDDRNGYTADKAIDGNGSTRWSSDGSRNPESITVDLSESYNLSHVILQWEGAYASEYKLQVSEDGETWEDVLHETDGSGGTETITLNRKARYVRMSGISAKTQYGFSLYEFEIYGTAVPLENIALNKPATALESTTQEGQGPDRAFDGNRGTRWGASEDPNNWLQVDLEDFYEIRQIDIFWEDSFAKGYKLQVSNDGLVWTDIHVETDGIGGLEEIDSFEPTVARYVRMQGVEKAGQWGYSIYEFEVYGVPAEAPAEVPEAVEVGYVSDESQGEEEITIGYQISGIVPDVEYNLILAGYTTEGQMVSHTVEAGSSNEENEDHITMPNTGDIDNMAFMVWDQISQAPLTGGFETNEEGGFDRVALPEVIGSVNNPEIVVEADEETGIITVTGSGFAGNGMVTILSKIEEQIDHAVQILADENGDFTYTYTSDFSLSHDTTPVEQGELKVSVGGQGVVAPIIQTETVDVTIEADPQVTKVINLIDKIDETVTLDSEEAIVAAREAYDLLSNELQALITNYDILEAAESKYVEVKAAQEAVDEVIALISDIGVVELTGESLAKIDAAKAAYDALSTEQKEKVTNAATLTAAQDVYKALAEDKDVVALVIAKINEIGTVAMTDGSKQKLEYARAAYESLTPKQKALVTNLGVLQEAETKYQTLVKEKAAADKAATDKNAANAVIAKINGIGKVNATAASKKKIDDAMAAYNALSAEQKKLVTNLSVLTAAQATYTSMTTAPKKGTTFNSGNYRYRVVKAATAKAQGTVRVIGTTNKNITSVKINTTVKSGVFTYRIVSIGNKAFRNLKKLKKVTIGNNVTEIGSNAFSGCGKLTKVTIGKGVKKIGSKAFNNSKKLKSIVIKSTKITTVGKNAFRGIHGKARIRVPRSRVNRYNKLFKGKGQKSTVKITK